MNVFGNCLWNSYLSDSHIVQVLDMGFREYSELSPSLLGYDPCVDVPQDHLARFVDMVIEEALSGIERADGRGQPAYDPRLCIKVLVYGYATGVRSSRQLERNCRESLPYLLLTRGDAPSYRTLCTVRVEQGELLDTAWIALFVSADGLGLGRLGRVVVDSTKLRANASEEMTIVEDEYGLIRAALTNAIAEAEAVDAREDGGGYSGETRTGKKVDKCQMRDIVRSVRSRLAKSKVQDSATVECVTAGDNVDGVASDDSISDNSDGQVQMTSRMVDRAKEVIRGIDRATSEGQKCLCLTDMDARFMHGGREKRLKQCHSLEVAIDRDCALLVASGVTQVGNDNGRLEGLVSKSLVNEPWGVKAVDGDSGYFRTDSVARLIADGVDVCIPDSTTACALHRSLPVLGLWNPSSVALEYDAIADVYRCSEGNVLTRRPSRTDKQGQRKINYQACRSCCGCRLHSECMVTSVGQQPRSKYKHIFRREHSEVVLSSLERFNDPVHRERYRQRASAVETVFGFIRGTLGFDRWLLRGSEKTECEGQLMTLAYQTRKVHKKWAIASG